jgi:Sulfotransferase family
MMHHWNSLFPGKILRVPYERLVADQESVSRQILEHCGLPWDPAVLDFHTSSRPVQTASLGQVGVYPWLC